MCSHGGGPCHNWIPTRTTLAPSHVMYAAGSLPRPGTLSIARNGPIEHTQQQEEAVLQHQKLYVVCTAVEDA